jgi:hypothetical protein
MAYITTGLGGAKTPSKTRQKTIKGTTWKVRIKYHYGAPIGFSAKKFVDGGIMTEKPFRNWKGLDFGNSMLDAALDWAIKNL